MEEPLPRHGRPPLRLPDQSYLTDQNVMSTSMKLSRRKRRSALWLFPVLLLSNSCGEEESVCASLEARNSVVRILSDDSNNKLVDYAVKNSSSVEAIVSSANTEAEKMAIWETARKGAAYRLDDTILTNSRNRATGSVNCSGLLYVTVGDTTAEKQVDFDVERKADGKMSVSVHPFLF
jgi:hypothetical protein